MSLPTAVHAHVAGHRSRMRSEERRDQILAAARTVFAEGGYQATTDQVARAAGVSQPYVVRLFGSKRDLFLAVYRDAAARVLAAFRPIAAGPDAAFRMGAAYAAMLSDRDQLRILMQGFIAGTDEEVGAIARHTLGEVHRMFLERTGGTPDEGRTFIATGMLINVLLAVDAPAHLGEDTGMDTLLACVLAGVDGLEAVALSAGEPDER
ncbi:MAG TPA: TetR family transcriptional regulator [Cellulomonas sp.]